MKKIFTIGLITLLLTNCSDVPTNTRNGSFKLADWLKKVYKIELPKSAKIIHEYDNGEGHGETIYTIEKSDINNLISKYKFLPIDSLVFKFVGPNVSAQDRIDIIERYGFRIFVDEKLKIINNPKVLYHEDYTDKTSYTLFLDTNQTYLWLSVSYPDWAGN